MSMDREEMLALADRIDGLPAYSGRDLQSKLYQSDMPENTASRDISVIMIQERHRGTLAAALRAAPARCDALRESLRQYARNPEVAAAVQQAIMKHPHWSGGSAFAFGLANTAIDAFTVAISSAQSNNGAE